MDTSSQSQGSLSEAAKSLREALEKSRRLRERNELRHYLKLEPRCDYCGRFIALESFENGQALRDMVTPDSDYSRESWETYHILCAIGTRR